MLKITACEVVNYVKVNLRHWVG